MEKAWWKEAVVYQIYPRKLYGQQWRWDRRYQRDSSRLDYLQQLGISVIWLSPVYQSPNDDNGYDISDYQAIMTEFGTMEDFDEMLTEAHKRGIRILMDLVVNHTSDEHKWFVESRRKKTILIMIIISGDLQEGNLPPNNWGSVFGGSAWQYDEERQMYYLHLFSKKQPDLNWDNPQVRKEVFDMMNWWCEKGIDGFRMDVISMISKTKEMPDGETHGGKYGDFGKYCIHGPNVHKYLKEMNEKVLSRYDIMTVGETAGVTVEEARKYAGKDEHELNMVFQFEHVDGGKYGKWTDEPKPLTELKQILSKWQTQLYGKAWNSLFWDNHDQPRVVSRYGNDSKEYREVSAKMLATCLHMMQGTPYIYQGEELGMTNYPFKTPADFHDIESINAYREWCESGSLSHEIFWPCLTFISRDNARTPVQWDDSQSAGFTTGTPWMPVNPNYKEINAKAELQDPQSVFYYYKKLIQLRKEYPVIVYGKYQLLLPDDPDLFVYTRELEKEKLLVVCNFSGKEQSIQLPEEFVNGKCLISNLPGQYDQQQVQLKPYQAFVLYR